MAQDLDFNEEMNTMLSESLEHREEFEKQWVQIGKILDGDYEPLMGNVDEAIDVKEARVKTHLLSNIIETNIAVTMPPPDMDFYCEPANKKEGVDKNTADTGKAILSYYNDKHSDYDEFLASNKSYQSENRAVMMIGVKPDVRGGKKAPAKQKILETLPYEGDDKKWGQTYLECIPNKHFLRARGFRTIKQAWSSAGWVAMRRFLANDWIKSNPQFKAYDPEIKDFQGDIRSPYIELDIDKSTSDPSVQAVKDQKLYKFNIVWYIFHGPSDKYPNGRYTVYSQKQKRTIFHQDEKLYKGLNFPFVEVIDVMPSINDYAMAKAYRAKNAYLVYEYFETKVLNGVKDAKTLVPYTDDVEWGDGKDHYLNRTDKALVPVKVNQVNIQENLAVIPIPVDINPAAEGAIRARAMVEKIMGVGFSDPRLSAKGGKIATEMVFQNQIQSATTNKQITKFNRFINEVETAQLILTQEKVAPQEQARMTREMSKVWVDNNAITLEGNYIVTVKGSPLLSMSQGERGKIMQMVMQTLVSLQAIPAYNGKIDVTGLIKEWVATLGFSEVGLIRDYPERDQWHELTLMLAGIPVEVEPDDNDVEHLAIMQEFQVMINKAGKQMTMEEQQIVMQHAAAHMEQVQQQEQGAAKGMNQENQMRESMGQVIGSQGSLGLGGA